MRVLRNFGKWVTVVVAVVGWILFVPVVNVLGHVFNRLAGLAGSKPALGVGAPGDGLGLETRTVQQSHAKEHGKRAA
jgi:hypothetical protein